MPKLSLNMPGHLRGRGYRAPLPIVAPQALNVPKLALNMPKLTVNRNGHRYCDQPGMEHRTLDNILWLGAVKSKRQKHQAAEAIARTQRRKEAEAKAISPNSN
jgi:hypothetical protein